MKKPTEQRALPRKNLIYYTDVFNHETNELLGNIVDINERGLKLISRAPIEPHQLFQLRVELPERVNLGKDILLAAQSRWCDRDINDDYFVSGFQFSDTNWEDKDTIIDLIRKYGFEHDA